MRSLVCGVFWFSVIRCFSVDVEGEAVVFYDEHIYGIESIVQFDFHCEFCWSG